MQHLANQSGVTEPAVLAVNQSKVMEFMWNYLFDPKADKYLEKVLANKTVIAFSDIFKHTTKVQVMLYFEKIVNILETVSKA